MGTTFSAPLMQVRGKVFWKAKTKRKEHVGDIYRLQDVIKVHLKDITFEVVYWISLNQNILQTLYLLLTFPTRH
jgi:hypothetical protein